MKNFLRYCSIFITLTIIVGMLAIFAIPTSAASGSTYSSNPTIAARIDKVLAAYKPGNSFFTKNGKACSCHANSNINCVNTPSNCNCLRKVTIDGKTVDLLATQCFGYARYWQQMLFGAIDTNTSKFQKLSGVSGSLTAANTKTWFTNNKNLLHPGTHIRVYYEGHSIILLNVDYDQGKVTYIQSNWVKQSTNNGTWCSVSDILTKTWSSFASTFSTLDYAKVYKNYYTEYPSEAKDYIATEFKPTIKDGIYTLKIAHVAGTVINVYNGSVSCKNGTEIDTWVRDGSIEQKFYFKHESNGKYRIYAVCSGASGSLYNKVVDVNVGSDGILNLGDKFNVWSKDASWDNCQLFYIVPIGGGKYVIELASMPNAVLSAKSAETAATNGGDITLMEYKNHTTQQWYFYNESGSAFVDPSFNGDYTYTVSYSANGGTNAPAAQTKLYGGSVTISSTIPTRNGYRFVGWSTSNDNTVEYQAGATYTANSNVTLYAVWSTNDYSVAYNANGGTNAPSAQTKLHDIALTLSSTIPTRNGYRFVGWSTSNDTSVEYQAGATYTANANVTLYAVWKVNEYTVSYDANGGTNAPATQRKVHDTALTLSSTIPTRNGYRFVGWSTSNDTSVEYQAGATYTANANVTLYAVWKVNEYTVSYDANGGTNAPATQRKVHDTALTLSSTTPTKSGYSFLGWSTSNDASVEYQAGASYTNNADVTLYAVWQKNEVTVPGNTTGDTTGDTTNGTTDKITNGTTDSAIDDVESDKVVDTEASIDDIMDNNLSAEKYYEIINRTDETIDDVIEDETEFDKKNKFGCNSSVAISGLFAVGAIGAAVAFKKKKED